MIWLALLHWSNGIGSEFSLCASFDCCVFINGARTSETPAMIDRGLPVACFCSELLSSAVACAEPSISYLSCVSGGGGLEFDSVGVASLV